LFEDCRLLTACMYQTHQNWTGPVSSVMWKWHNAERFIQSYEYGYGSDGEDNCCHIDSLPSRALDLKSVICTLYSEVCKCPNMPPSLTSLLFFITSFGLHVCAVTQVPNGAIAVPLTRGEDLVAYYAEFSVGTPPQKERLLVDTGSPTYSFIDPRSAWCNSSSKPCQYYGTYDNRSSS